MATAAVVALVSAPAFAQENADSGATEEGTTLLDRITIVSRTGDSAIESMASVSHIDQEQLDRRMATTPGDVFFGVPGVEVQTDSRRVASGINIRGLQDFGRVAVIVDGARQNFQRSDHGTQSMVFIDPALIEQVDVVRGPVANTYGSGAIGGVVVFETKDAEDFLKSDETWGISTTGRYETNGDGWTTSAVGAYRINDAVDVIGNLVWRDFDDYDDGDGDPVEGTGFDVLSGLLKSTIRPTENSELKLGWIGANDSWIEGGDVYDADLTQNTFTARYNVTDPYETWLDLHANVFYNMAGLDQTYLQDVPQFHPETGRPIIVPTGSQTTYDLDTFGFDIWNTSRFDTGALYHELTYGGDWLQDDVVTASPAGGSDVYTPSGSRQVGGVYIQDKLTWNWLEVIGGLRYDSYKLEGDDAESSGDRISPRITVGVSPFSAEAWQGLQFYGTYAEGYRSPTITETLISGLHPVGFPFPFIPNPDLKPETAKTWEFGVNYSMDDLVYAGDMLRLKGAYFNNGINDYIEGRYYRQQNFYQYQNLAEAEIRGFELEAAYDAGHFFGGVSASIIDGHTISYGGVREDLLTVPSSQVTGYLGFRMLEERVTFGGEVQYNGAPDGNEFADDYTLVNVFARYHVNDNFELDFRVDNLFDVNYRNPLIAADDTLRDVFEPGLSLKFAATYRFGG